MGRVQNRANSAMTTKRSRWREKYPLYVVSDSASTNPLQIMSDAGHLRQRNSRLSPGPERNVPIDNITKTYMFSPRPLLQKFAAPKIYEIRPPWRLAHGHGQHARDRLQKAKNFTSHTQAWSTRQGSRAPKAPKGEAWTEVVIDFQMVSHTKKKPCAYTHKAMPLDGNLLSRTRHDRI
jgi:hypothetical protein